MEAIGPVDKLLTLVFSPAGCRGERKGDCLKILWVGLCFLLAPTVRAADTAEIRRALFLYEIEKKDGVKAVGELLPARVHLKYSDEANQWVFVLSNLGGQVRGKEFLGPGTVLAGFQLGAKEPHKHFLLDEKGNWQPTDKKLQVMRWKSLRPARFELETFQDGSEKVAIVTPKK